MTTMRQRNRGSDRCIPIDACRADLKQSATGSRGTRPHPRVSERVPQLRQSLAHPNEVCRQRGGVAPLAFAIAIGEVEAQRCRVGVDDDLGPAETARGLFRELQQNAAVALPLEIARMAMRRRPA